jgi:hypothetical protein
MKILSCDLGKSYGWCFLHNDDMESGHGKQTNLVDWGTQFKALLDKWKPEIVVLSQTNNFGYWGAARSGLMLAGAAFYICGKKDIPGIELNDSSARKAVFGKALKKKEVQVMFPNVQPDELDSQILAKGWQILQKDSQQP